MSIRGFTAFGGQTQSLLLHQHQSKPFELYENNTVDALVRGLLMQPAQKMDRAFTDEVWQLIFTLNFGLIYLLIESLADQESALPRETGFRDGSDRLEHPARQRCINLCSPSTQLSHWFWLFLLIAARIATLQRLQGTLRPAESPAVGGSLGRDWRAGIILKMCLCVMGRTIKAWRAHRW